MFSVIPFTLPGFVVEQVDRQTDVLVIHARATRSVADCPICHQPATRVHSQYRRTPQDLPVSEDPVRLVLHLRRFFCDYPLCPRQTFVERYPEWLPDRAQRTLRLTRTLQVLADALGGRPAAAMIGKLRMRASHDTLLRLVRQTPVPPAPPPRVLGVDDFAFRKGHRYGTILVDLERHQPIDLLPDRSAASLEAWLRAHPSVTVIARDRSTEYAGGASAGAPDALQVADRWHMLVNLREALERLLDRQRPTLETRFAQLAESAPQSPDSLSVPVPVRRRQRSGSETAASSGRRERRLARYAAVQALHAHGKSKRAIALELGISRWLARRLVEADAFPERAPQHLAPSILTPFEQMLIAAWNAGERNSLALWRQIQAQGYDGSAKTVRRWVQARRTEPAPRTRTIYRAGLRIEQHAPAPRSATRPRFPSSRQLVWLLLRPADQLTEDDCRLATILREEPVIATAADLAQQFQTIVRQRQAEHLDSWVMDCVVSGSEDLANFARGLQDDAAVRAALYEPWSTGPVEGEVTKRKLLIYPSSRSISYFGSSLTRVQATSAWLYDAACQTACTASGHEPPLTKRFHLYERRRGVVDHGYITWHGVDKPPPNGQRSPARSLTRTYASRAR